MEFETDQQLNLFGEPEPRGIRPHLESPLSTDSVKEALADFPGLYLGTSSWNFPGWKGLVYQSEHRAEELSQNGLRAYSQVKLFRTVSLDRTYYRTMTEAQFAALAGKVDEDFRFVVKGPRDLLKPSPSGFSVSDFTRDFLTPAVRGLGPKLGVVLLQFPPGTAAESGRNFSSHLGTFLRGLPQNLAYSLELRDQSLFGPELRQSLAGSSTSICASIHPQLPDPDKQLLTVPPNPDTPLVFRWNLRPSLEYEEARKRFHPYNKLSMEDPRRRTLLVRLLTRALAAGRTVYMTSNNKAEGSAPLTLLRLLEELSSKKA